MKIQNTLLMLTAAIMVSACGSTFEGLQKDIGKLGNSVNSAVSSNEEETGNRANVVMKDNSCPPIIVNPQLDSLTEFEDMENAEEGTETSSITLSSTQSSCEEQGEFLNMRIDLTFDAALGPKAKREENDRPFFAYPYFIAVLDGSGEELAREVFAASVTYGEDQNQIQLVETIRQNLPLTYDGEAPDYQIEIGFQLTEEQLFYNTSQDDN
jgi:predicted small secreted protein